MNNFKDRKIDYAYKSLTRYPKDELIAMIWQHRDYIEKLEKVFNLACEELADSCKCDDETKVYFNNGKVKYAYDMTMQEWKEYLTEGDEK